MSLAAGSRLGPYEIRGALGAGGMGEVYRARDTRLGREVALKILPREVAGDASRRKRFELEARAVAALSHPNIVAVYDAGDEGGVLYIVSELVDGESLRGAKFALRKKLDIAVQIASGLAAAHAAGIVHRDLKPANILVTRDGRAKILDFGLAKVTAKRSDDAETATLSARTEPGMVVGTVSYMSPEQVRGQETDGRSDIFSLGLILYELLSGRRAFGGETKVEIMSAILKQEPPELPDTVPPAVRQIVARCLEKERADRFQSAQDLGFALGQSSGRSGAAPAVVSGKRGRRRSAASAGLLVAVLVAGIWCGKAFFSPAAAHGWSAAMLEGPEMAAWPRLSPDGHLLAFVAIIDGQAQPAVMKPETGNWSPLSRDRGRGGPLGVSWSPDGSQVYYDRVTDAPVGIFRSPVLGGEEHLVLENAEYPEPLLDGSLLCFRLNAQRQAQLYRYWPENGRLREYSVQLAAQVLPVGRAAAPGSGEAVVFGIPLGRYSEQPGFLAVDLGSGAIRRLAAAPAALSWTIARGGKSILAAAPAGALTRVLEIPMGGSGGEKVLYTVTSDVWMLEAAPDGAIYTNVVDRPVDVVRLALDGAAEEKIGTFTRVQKPDILALLADGGVVVPAGAPGHIRLMVAAKGKDPAPLVNTAEETAAPVTPVGTREIAFMIGREPRQMIALADIATGRILRRLAGDKGAVVSLAASPDGRTLYFAAGGRIWSMPSAGGEAKAIRAGDCVIAQPDGGALLVAVSESSRVRLFHVPLDGSAEREVVIHDRGSLQQVSPLTSGAAHPDGRVLVSMGTIDSWFNAIGVLDPEAGRITRKLADPRNDYHTVAWDGQGRIVALRMGLKAAIWKFTPQVK
jgi:Tol biopolymer transport system component